MTAPEFLALVLDLKGTPEAIQQRLADAPIAIVDGLHGAIGASEEAGEVLSHFKKHLAYGKAIDRAAVLEEIGDQLHYIGYVLKSIDATFEEAMAGNIEKLRKRYPEGFTEEAALARADKQPAVVIAEHIDTVNMK